MSTDLQISEQLRILQECEQEMRDMLKQLGEHNQDPDSHPIILRMIKALEESEAMYTRHEIASLIEDRLKLHTAKELRDAHAGYAELVQSLQLQIDKALAEIDGLKKRLDVEQPNAEGYNTALEVALQAVEDKYAPALANLSTAYQEAEKQGNDVLAQSYMDAISTTLEEKRQELLQTMRDWAVNNKR